MITSLLELARPGALELQAAALEGRAGLDGQLLVGDVAVDAGGGEQPHLLGGDRADHPAAAFDRLGGDRAFDLAGLADGQARDVQVAADQAPSRCRSPSPVTSPLDADILGRSGPRRPQGLGAPRRRQGAPDEPWWIGGLLGLLNIVACLQETVRVHGAAVDPHLVVQVGAGGAAGGAHAADALAHGHVLANADGDRRQVRVAGLEAPAVVDLDRVAVAGAYAGEGDHARGGGVDRGHEGAGEVLAGVEGRLAGEGIEPHAEAGVAAWCWSAGRRAAFSAASSRARMASSIVAGGVLDAAGEVLVHVEHGGQRAGSLDSISGPPSEPPLGM